MTKTLLYGPRTLSLAAAHLILLRWLRPFVCRQKLSVIHKGAATRCAAVHFVRPAGSSAIRESRIGLFVPGFAFLCSRLSQTLGSMPSMQRCVLWRESIAPRFF